MNRPVVLVLAGGASHRAWPLRDKLGLRFGSDSLLDRHLAMLTALGCDRVIAVANPHNQDSIAAALAAGAAEARVVVQPEPRGMADAVLCAADALTAFGESSVYITQAHDIVDAGLHRSMLSALDSESSAFGWMAAQAVGSYFPGGYLKVEGDRVLSVVEKPAPGEEPSDLVNIVAHAFRSWRDLLPALEAEAAGPGTDDAYERALTRLLEEREVHAVRYEGRWQALKYPWDVLGVMEMLLQRWSDGREAPGAGFEQREDGVFLGSDVTLNPGSHVVAPALIGPGTIIGHNALVRGSVVGAGCVVGFGSEVARSYLADGVELHHSYVGDSVLDSETSLGFGATTANVRVDGRSVPSQVGDNRVDSGRMKLGMVAGAGVRIGVNTSIMPGAKIGAGAIIGPNLRVGRDVPDGKMMLDQRSHGRI